MADLIRLKKSRSPQRGLFFTKKELGQLLALYSSRVISGEWRDYAIDHSDDGAAFSCWSSSSISRKISATRISVALRRSLLARQAG